MIGSGTFRSLESAEGDQTAAAMTGVEVEISALGPSRSKHRIIELDLGPVCLRWGRVGADVSLTGAVQPGIALFSTTLLGSPPTILNGQPVGSDSIARLAPGAAYAVSIPEGGQWICLRLDAPWFERHYGGVMPASQAPVEVLVSSRLRNRALRLAFAEAWSALHAGRLLNDVRLRSRFRANAVAALIASVGGASRSAPPQSPKALALRHLHRAHRDSALRLDDLCEHLNVGERSLRRLFADLYGVSPAQYLRARRLHQARRALRRGAGARSVTEIAMSLGFSDLGRFAAHYRSLFGELPSDTLRCCRQGPESGIT